MRKIKFRGRTCGNVMVYGDLRHVGSTAVIDDTAVYEDSIAQLVGLDANNREVYEGDVLIDELEQEYTAEIYDRPEKIRSLKLKEAQP